jgi:hypothetical protein
MTSRATTRWVVLLTAIGSVVVGVLIYLPRLLAAIRL